MTRTPQRRDDTHLLVGRELCKDHRLLCAALELFVRKRLDLRPFEHMVGGDADCLRHGHGDTQSIAGKHLGCHAVCGERLDGRSGAPLGRIQEGKIADKLHVALVFCREGTHVPCAHLHCHSKDTHAAPPQICRLALDEAAHLRSQRLGHASELSFRAGCERFLDSPLLDHKERAIICAYDDRDTPAAEVEGQLVCMLSGIRESVRIESACALRLERRTLDDGRIHQVLGAGAEEAVEVGIAQDPCILLAIQIEMALEDHMVFLVPGKRPVRSVCSTASTSCLFLSVSLLSHYLSLVD